MMYAFMRAFVIVALTGANVALIADRAWIPMFCTGTALSFVWWGNAKAAAVGGRREQIAYALGAGCGTVIGVWAVTAR
ncbi:MAG: hypothetical protein NTY02_09355 [Acidobacteria bacterium]|nr:hypothetical protein [Acidobacteriota bacterium]